MFGLTNLGIGVGGSARRAAIARQLTQTQTYSDVILADNPVGYWRLDETSGTIATDQTNTHDGTFIAGGGNTLGAESILEQGNALQLDPTSGNVGVDLGFNTNFTSECTVEIWAWPASTQSDGFPHLITKNSFYATDRDDFPIRFYYNNNRFGLGLSYGDDFSVNLNLLSSSVISEVWHHVVGIYRGNGNCELWVNGVLEDSGTSTSTISINTRNWRIGTAHGYSDGAGEHMFAGKLDEATIYDYALTADQIRKHYYAGIGYTGYPLEVLSNGPVAYWRLDETSGTTANDETGNHDLTINGNPVLNASPLIQTGTAIEFDGNDDDAEGLYIGSLSFPVTLEAWVIFNDTDNFYRIVNTHWVNGTYYGASLQVSNAGEFSVSIGNGTDTSPDGRRTFITNEAFSIGVSYHVVGVVHASNDMDVYVDAVNKSGTLSGNATSMNTSSGVPNIGRHPGAPSRCTPMVCDEVVIYDHALTAQEITDLYNAGTGN